MPASRRKFLRLIGAAGTVHGGRTWQSYHADGSFRLSVTAGLGGLLSACGGKGEPPPAPTLPGDARPSLPGGSQRYREAPMLAEQVARGELPPVDERLPAAPCRSHRRFWRSCSGG